MKKLFNRLFAAVSDAYYEKLSHRCEYCPAMQFQWYDSDTGYTEYACMFSGLEDSVCLRPRWYIRLKCEDRNRADAMANMYAAAREDAQTLEWLAAEIPAGEDFRTFRGQYDTTLKQLVINLDNLYAEATKKRGRRRESNL